MKWNKFVMSFCMVLLLSNIVFCPMIGRAYARDDFVTVSQFIKLMVHTAKIPINHTDKNPYREALVRAGIIKKSEYINGNKEIVKADAAVLANRTEEYLYGSTYNELLYQQVMDKNRIYDLKKLSKKKRPDIIKVFIKGIMIGRSKGKCEQSRMFDGNLPIKKEEASAITKRVGSKKARKKISPDGQVIRTNNLPKNYKDYEYILESFPNSFYEAPFDFQRTKYYFTPKELINYARPNQIKKMKFDPERGLTMGDIMEQHLDQWCSKVEQNLKCRFNVDYRTIGDQWINDIRGTYYIWDFGGKEDALENKRITDDIKHYVKTVKDNKVIVKAAAISVEPSGMYDATGLKIRVYVRFKVLQASNIKKQNNIFYGDIVSISGLKKNQWLERYFDIGIGSRTWGLTGEDFAVTANDLIDLEWK